MNVNPSIAVTSAFAARTGKAGHSNRMICRSLLGILIPKTQSDDCTLNGDRFLIRRDVIKNSLMVSVYFMCISSLIIGHGICQVENIL
jgi:hypothetical protein